MMKNIINILVNEAMKSFAFDIIFILKPCNIIKNRVVGSHLKMEKIRRHVYMDVKMIGV